MAVKVTLDMTAPLTIYSRSRTLKTTKRKKATIPETTRKKKKHSYTISTGKATTVIAERLMMGTRTLTVADITATKVGRVRDTTIGRMLSR